jgi:two-component sensor histidine kinase
VVFRKIIVVATWCLCLSSYAQVGLLQKAESCHVIDSSITYAEQFIKQCAAQKDTLSWIDGNTFLARRYEEKSKYAKAEKLIEEGLRLTSIKRDVKREGLLYLAMGDKYNFENDNVKALNLYLKAYDLFEKINDNTNFLKSIVDLAEFHRKIRAYNDAKAYIAKGFDIYHKRKITDTLSLLRLNNRLAAIMIETGKVDSSIYFSNVAIALSRESNNNYSEAVSLNEKGYAFKNIAKLDSAIICYQKAESIWKSIGADREALSAMNNRAMLYSNYHYPKTLILEIYSKMIDLVNTKKIDYPLTDVYSTLSQQYLNAGDTSKAFIYREKYYQVKMDLLKKMYDVGITDIKEKYENAKIKKDFFQISSELKESQVILTQKNRENVIIYTFIVILLLLIFFVFYLLYQLFQSNKRLKQKNTEKDTLIQEIHHRVKNNLQFVSSLINMQINASDNSNEAFSLNDASRRIKAMALVHEMLYNQNELQGINIQQYLLELVDSINELVNSTHIPIQLNVSASNIIFDTQRAIAIGMITSELISNSIKYAFSNTTNPLITVLLTQESDRIIYSVQDNGDGIKETNEQRKKLGMRLISIFSRQLKGEYTFENINGYKYLISFKY